MTTIDTSTVPESMLEPNTPSLAPSFETPPTTTTTTTTPKSTPPQKKRRRRTRYHRDHNSTLKVSSKRREQHQKEREFDVEVTLHNGSIALIRLNPTPMGWRESILAVTKKSDDLDLKYDLYRLVSNEYVLCETPREVLQWMETDYSKVRVVTY
tara:strand:- start:387 stop:848 length:462 start_codon:yes stop_codon:yes gene_type:complete